MVLCKQAYRASGRESRVVTRRRVSDGLTPSSPNFLSVHQVSVGVHALPQCTGHSIIAPSKFWMTQPHEQIITTVTPFRIDISVPLSILKYTDISNRLKFFDGSKDRTRVSHVAVLNHTAKVDKDGIDGAFCLLLYRPLGSAPACFHRCSYFPALVPNIGEFASRMRKENILILGPDLGT